METKTDKEDIYRTLRYYESKLREIHGKVSNESHKSFAMLQEEVTHNLELAQQFPDNQELKDLAERVSEQMRRLDATGVEGLLDN